MESVAVNVMAAAADASCASHGNLDFAVLAACKCNFVILVSPAQLARGNPSSTHLQDDV